MPDSDSTSDSNSNLPPPGGDPAQAEKYINQLIELIDTDKLDVLHTDLAKFDPSSLEDHYRIELQDYRVEISHSKYPNSGKDSFIILFTNIKNLADGESEKIILAYMHLDPDQFAKFKKASQQHFDRKSKAEEEKRLNEALLPINEALTNLTT